MESQRCSVVTNLKRSSVLDNSDNDHIPKVFDATFIEVNIFSLFRIDILNLIKVKALLGKEFHIQPSEIDNMPAWEYELFMKEINILVKEENDRNKQEMDKSGYKDAQKLSNPKTLSNIQKSSTPKMPSISINGDSFKTPKM